ncbi:MAG: pilus assembly protein [Acetobacteraceae bacterium]|nr:pilus assembly protein [Acetobacteraceae bacterium]
MTRRFAQDRRGVAALEFAIIGPVLMLMLGMMTDLSLALAVKTRLAQAVDNGAQYAFTVGATVSASAVQAVVQASTTLTGVSVVVTGPALSCTSGSPATLSADPTGAVCADGTTPGTYLTLVASTTYAPLLPGISNMVGTVVQQSANVRLQ